MRAREEAEEQKRQHLIQLWEQQQRLVEQRRREREEFFKRVSDGRKEECEGEMDATLKDDERGRLE